MDSDDSETFIVEHVGAISRIVSYLCVIVAHGLIIQEHLMSQNFVISLLTSVKIKYRNSL